MNKYDARARLVFHFAREEGEKLGHTVIDPEHLLLGLLRVGGTASRVLGDVGVTLGEARRLTGLVGQAKAEGERAISLRTERVMKRAGLEADRLGSEHVRTEHILLAIVGEGGKTGSRILQNLAEPDDVRRHLETALSEAAVGRSLFGRPVLKSVLATAVKV